MGFVRGRAPKMCPNRRGARLRFTSKHQQRVDMSEAPESIASTNKRRRVDGSVGGGNVRLCPHCGRTFKRTEHLSRHVRTRKSIQPAHPKRDRVFIGPMQIPRKSLSRAIAVLRSDVEIYSPGIRESEVMTHPTLIHKLASTLFKKHKAKAAIPTNLTRLLSSH